MANTLSTLVAATFVTAVLAGCAAPNNTGETLTVCSDIPYPPFEYVDESSPLGYSGFDMDLISAVGERIGREVSIVETGFDAITSGEALAAGVCDLAISAITITPERAEQIAFSDVYFEWLLSLLVNEGSTITSLNDLVSGVVVGVQNDTTGAYFAMENAPNADIVNFNEPGELVRALQENNIDAIIDDSVAIAGYLANSSSVVVDSFTTGEAYGIAFEKDSPLIAEVDAALAEIRADGTYDELVQRYFSG
jgi:polar amino acid transport system substrate-binding protein